MKHQALRVNDGLAGARMSLRPVLLAAGFMVLAAPAMAAQCAGSPAAGVDWQECNKKNVEMQASDLQGANLFSSDFSLTDFSGSNFNGANLEKATMVRTWLKGATALKTNFSRIEAYRSSFDGITAEDTNFTGAELQRASFVDAKLKNVDFEKAELGRTDFGNAALSGARFSYANLSRANFNGTTIDGPLAFDGAFMFLTRIEGLDLSGATGLQQQQIDMACGDQNTKLPSGLKASANWPCATD